MLGGSAWVRGRGTEERRPGLPQVWTLPTPISGAERDPVPVRSHRKSSYLEMASRGVNTRLEGLFTEGLRRNIGCTTRVRKGTHGAAAEFVMSEPEAEGGMTNQMRRGWSWQTEPGSCAGADRVGCKACWLALSDGTEGHYQKRRREQGTGILGRCCPSLLTSASPSPSPRTCSQRCDPPILPGPYHPRERPRIGSIWSRAGKPPRFRSSTPPKMVCAENPA